jgi:3-oxoacyl-[acyl-carrier-protein] synthase-3
LGAAVKLLGTGCFLPERVLTNADFERMVDTSDEWIVSRTGIRERHVLSDGEKNSDMAVQAGYNALQAARVAPGELDHIIVCTFTPDTLVPSAACIVQNRLDATKAGAVDLNSACTGFIAGLTHGAALVGSGQARRVLVIASEVLSRVTDYQDRSTCVLFGDGAGAAVLGSGEGGHAIGDFVLRADGSNPEALWIPAGGSTLPPSATTVAERLHFIKMNGREVFKFAVTKIIELIEGAAERAGIKPSEIDLVVPHQVNQRIIQAAVERLEMRPEQFFCNLEKYGNTSAASAGIALDEAVRQGRVKAGDTVVIAAFGGGFTWGSATIRW